MVLLKHLNHTASWLWFGGKVLPRTRVRENHLYLLLAVSHPIFVSRNYSSRLLPLPWFEPETTQSISDSKLSFREWSISQCLYARTSSSESFSFAVKLGLRFWSSWPGPHSFSTMKILSRIPWKFSISSRFRSRTFCQPRRAVRCLICKLLSPPEISSSFSLALS